MDTPPKLSFAVPTEHTHTLPPPSPNKLLGKTPAPFSNTCVLFVYSSLSMLVCLFVWFVLLVCVFSMLSLICVLNLYFCFAFSLVFIIVCVYFCLLKFYLYLFLFLLCLFYILLLLFKKKNCWGGRLYFCLVLGQCSMRYHSGQSSIANILLPEILLIICYPYIYCVCFRFCSYFASVYLFYYLLFKKKTILLGGRLYFAWFLVIL